VHRMLREAACRDRTTPRETQTIHNDRERHAQQTPDAKLLLLVPGVGVLTATATFAFVGGIGRFRNGRVFASFLGAHASRNTPRERAIVSDALRNAATATGAFWGSLAPASFLRAAPRTQRWADSQIGQRRPL